jgi:hypothetical protein
MTEYHKLACCIGVADLRAATGEAQARMEEAVQATAEEAARREREAADRRVVAAEKEVLLQSQTCASASVHRPPQNNIICSALFWQHT